MSENIEKAMRSMDEILPQAVKLQRLEANMKKRKAKEKRFQRYGQLSILLGFLFLVVFFYSIVSKGYTAFQQNFVELEVNFSESLIDPSGDRDPKKMGRSDFAKLIKDSLRAEFPAVKKRKERRALNSLVSSGASYQLRQMILDNPELIGTKQTIWVAADDEVDMLLKGHIDRNVPESDRRVKNNMIAWIDQLVEQGKVDKRFNKTFFTTGDSREPEQAGILGAIKGSFYVLLVTILLSFPIGVSAAVYLEEFAPKNKWTDIIEVNINNLAAVPSIVFGLLGLAIFINFFGLPRSAAVVGGLVLSLRTLPTIIIASRAAIKAVPPSIRNAAYGVGASDMQTVYHHVLPSALPGILTGTIIGMAQALGETAPLLMIGMVAFIVDIPQGIMDPATALPVQIYLWADSPERAFVEKTSATIMILLAFLALMNMLAVILRKRYERRW